MALPGVYQTDVDGNIGVLNETFPAEGVCGLLFDISGQKDFWTENTDLAANYKDKVVELNSYDDIAKSGIDEKVLGGIVKYHLDSFSEVAGTTNIRMFVAFADCSKDWKALLTMQRAAEGNISQFAVWTEQALWATKTGEDSYVVKLVSDIDRVLEKMATVLHSPAVVGLFANTTKVGDSSAIDFDKIPVLTGLNARRVAVILGQASNLEVRDMQDKLTSKTPVGAAGFFLGLLATLKVSQSIGWVSQCNLGNYNVSQCEMGFGDVQNGNYGKFESFDEDEELAPLHEKGYIFLRKFMGIAGVFFSANATCSDGDYRTITRNRTINKSRRLVRAALLPYTNAPVKVDPATGQMHAATISIFKDKVTDALDSMEEAEEISGTGVINLDPNQDVLRSDKIEMSYSIVPFGESQEIHIKEGFVAQR